MGLLWTLLIGFVAGWIAGKLVGGGGGLIFNIVIGVVGAYIGGPIFRALKINVGGKFGGLITAVAGAVVLLLLLRLVR